MKKSVLASAIVGLLFVGSASAEVKVNGFASIVGGKSTDGQLFGYDEDLSFNPESKFALQVSSDLGDKLSATAQIMAKGANDFNADFEWAYITYDLSDDWSVNVGRLRAPFFKYSDYLDVGYAYRWIRPPKSVYSLDFNTYEGISVLNTGQIGTVDYTFQGVLGGFDGDVMVADVETKAKLKNIVGFNVALAYDWLTVRGGYLETKATLDLSNNESIDMLMNGLDSASQTFDLAGASFENVSDSLLVNADTGTFLGLGFGIDYNNWLVDAEYTELRVSDSMLAKQNSGYISVGKRFDELTVHVTYEFEDDNSNTEALSYMEESASLMLPIGPNGMTIPLGSAPSIAALNDGVNMLLDAQVDEKEYWSVGLTYSFHSSALLKFDYTTVSNEKTNEDSGVLSAGVDIVF